jgi:glycosyltransferase involved in cell wall biosynthesis
MTGKSRRLAAQAKSGFNDQSPMQPFWSVLVCCHNSSTRVRPALQAICEQSLLGSQPIEVIAVDNASTDDTRAVIESFPVSANVRLRVITEPRPGLSNARRAAIAAASGDYLCFVDDDNDLAPDYLKLAQSIFDAYPDVCFCGGESSWAKNIRMADIPLVARFFSKSVAVGRQRNEAQAKIGPGEFLWGAGLCLRAVEAKALYAAGFIPVLTGRVGKQILSGEDGELTILLQLTGKRGYYASQLKLEHRVNLGRLNIRYYCRLFAGMGMAIPVLRTYQREVQVRTTATMAAFSPASARAARFANLSWWQIGRVMALYGWLGLWFARGWIQARFSKLPATAAAQARHLAVSLAGSADPA